MRLYLIRHAEALDVGELGIRDDESRPLSKRGQLQAQAVGRFFRERGLKIDVLLTSPLLRARQTAEDLTGALQSEGLQSFASEHLAPGGKRSRLCRHLRELASDAIALVGHEPDLGQLAGWLIGSRKARIDFAKAGVACLEFPDRPAKGDGALVWLVVPDWFEAKTGDTRSQ